MLSATRTLLAALLVTSQAAGQSTDRVDATNLGERGVVFEAPTGWAGMQYLKGIGDFNGDGFDDIGLCVVLQNEPFDDALVLIEGRTSLTGRHLISSSLSGARILRVGDPAAGNPLIETVTSVGDLDSDGLSDFVAGVTGYRNSSGANGAAFLFYGQPGDIQGEGVLEDAGNGRRGAIFFSSSPSDGSVGRVAANLGDFNGDGKPDLAISATKSVNPRGEANAGAVFVLYEARELPPAVDLAKVGTAVPGLRIYGPTRSTGIVGLETIGLLGQGIEAVGDFDGDGLADMLVTASELEPKIVYMIQGRRSLPPVIDLADADALENVIVFRGPGLADGRSFGACTQIAGIGDINGDGLKDVALGLARSCCPPPFTLPRNGAVHLFEGRGNFPRLVDFEDLPPDLSVVMEPLGLFDGFGRVVSGGGDLNLDGFPDLLFSSEAAVGGKERAGEAYAVFGKDFGPEVPLKDGFDGIRILGEDFYNGFGSALAPAGDFNGDGSPDILVMAPQVVDFYPGPARAYVIYGNGSGATPLTLQEVEPRSGPVRGGTRVVLRGSGFGGSPAVLFGKRAATGVTLLSGSEMSAMTPAASEVGPVDVTVTIAGASRRLAAAFEYTANLPEIDLAHLEGRGFILEGNTFGRWFTWPALSAIDFGDLSGDGVDELIVESSAVNGWTVSVVEGGPDLPPMLHAFTPSSEVTVITGSRFQSIDGGTVAMIGDVNADGVADLAIGSSDGFGYVLFGGGDLLGGELDVEVAVSTGKAARLEHSTVAESDVPLSFAPLGDVNGDGIGDFAVGFGGARVEPGESQDPGPNAGEVVIVPGARFWPDSLDLSDPALRLGRIHGTHGGQRLAGRLRQVGDVNRDGMADLLMDTAAQNGIGRAFLVYGTKETPENADVSSQVLAGGGVAIDLVDGFLHFDWFNVSAAGDVNADGFADLLLGVCGGGGSLQGVTYLVFGSDRLPSSMTIAENPAAPDGVVRIIGEGSMEQAGRPGPGGDFNQDGYADFLIGAPGQQGFLTEPGNVFLVFGGPSLPARIDLRRLGGRGIKIVGLNLQGGAGLYVGPAGDLNGDRLPDFAFSENGLVDGDTARVYVVYSPYSGAEFIRGDANSDGSVNLSDAIFILSYLFLGGPTPACLDAADVDDRSTVVISDAIYLLGSLFLGTPAPPEPFPGKGRDTTEDELSCLGV